MNKVEQALVDSMEQVLLYLKMNDSNSEFTLGTDNLINWFKKLDSRLEKKYEEIGRENFLNIGNRNVEIYGEDFFSNKDELKKILIGIKDSHFSPGIKLKLGCFVENFSTVLDWKIEQLISHVIVVINDTECPIDKEKLDRLFCDMIPYYSGFNIIGSYDALMHYGLFSMKSVCSAHLELSVVDEEIERLYPNCEKPCVNRISTIVYSDGYVYPCEGLVGLKNAAIDKINASSDEMKIFEERRKPLLEWYKDGPKLENEDIIVESDELPYYCRKHRAQLIEQSKGNCF